MRRLACLAVLPALLALAACGPGDGAEPTAQDLATAEAVAGAMLARYEANVGAVDGFTVVAEGAEARYTLSGDSTGLDRFGPPQVAPVGNAPVSQADAQLLFVQVPNVPRLAQGLRTAALTGPISRDGRRVYVLSTDDPGALLGEGMAPTDTAGIREVRVYVGAETFDVFEIYQSVTADTLDRAVTSRLIYSDFREVDGLTLPFTVRQVGTGLDFGISEEERVVLGGQLGLAIQQTQGAPPGPERDARLAELETQQRLVTEGVADTQLEVESVRVGTGEE